MTENWEAIASGTHLNPFGFLGPHAARNNTQVRTFQPQAQTVSLIDDAGQIFAKMRKIHRHGGFSGRLETRDQRYRLRLTYPDGSVRDIEDCFRFPSSLDDFKLHLIGEGKHLQLGDSLGAHSETIQGVSGVRFAVWAPNAGRVSVIGPFNDWDGRCHPMRLHPGNGVWDIFVPGLGSGEMYKFEIIDNHGKLLPLKADPFGRFAEPPPGNASIVNDSHYRWSDDEWMRTRPASLALNKPVSVYEVHLGSWKRCPEENNRWLSYRELAEKLVTYVGEMGFTHIELLPVTEHPFDGSWGYQPIGLFAPTWRFGIPDDFRYLIDRCHQAGIGVIMDWVPAHFPRDEHGLNYFDGTALYEHADPRKGTHADWGTLIFNYGRKEVANYLISNALMWVDDFHIDGLRVDAVASMLYLDYSRKPGEWVPNASGGNENFEAVAFLKQLNEYVHGRGAVTIAEESTAWPMVSRPTYDGGLGFSYKWNMGWMNDTLSYMGEEPVHRKFHHDRLTFSLVYAFSENFVLPISHDEVVHGKGSMYGRMPGDRWQKFANLRAYYGFMFAHPGKKLLFMGCEFGQVNEWNHDQSLDWDLLNDPAHKGLLHLVRDLNDKYKSNAALYDIDFEPAGFTWISADDRDQSVIAFVRHATDGNFVIAVCNLTPVPRNSYRIGVPSRGTYRAIINTDAKEYGGSGVGTMGNLMTQDSGCHGQPVSLLLTLPPLATLLLSLQNEIIGH